MSFADYTTGMAKSLRYQTMRGQRGMTLLEVLIALMISAIGMVGTLSLVALVVRGSDYTRSMTDASLIAQTQLERLVTVPKTQLAAQCTAVNGSTVSRFTGGVSTPIRYTVGCTRSTCGTLTCIDIGVSWVDSANRSHTVTQQRGRVP